MNLVTMCDAQACRHPAAVRVTVESLDGHPIHAGQTTVMVEACDEHAEMFEIGDDDLLLSTKYPAVLA